MYGDDNNSAIAQALMNQQAQQQGWVGQQQAYNNPAAVNVYQPASLLQAQQAQPLYTPEQAAQFGGNAFHPNTFQNAAPPQNAFQEGAANYMPETQAISAVQPTQQSALDAVRARVLLRNLRSTGNYDEANELAQSVGAKEETPSMFKRMTDILTGQNNDQHGTIEQVAQFSLPFIMKYLANSARNKYLHNNGGMVNAQAASNLAAQQKLAGFTNGGQ